jgi:hypothetical protein
VLLSLLLSLPFGQPVLMHECPFLRWRIRQHLPSRLVRQILPTTFMHQLDELLLYNGIVVWLGKIETLWSE